MEIVKEMLNPISYFFFLLFSSSDCLTSTVSCWSLFKYNSINTWLVLLLDRMWCNYALKCVFVREADAHAPHNAQKRKKSNIKLLIKTTNAVLIEVWSLFFLFSVHFCVYVWVCVAVQWDDLIICFKLLLSTSLWPPPPPLW